jgi:hypothetical protein
MHHLLRQIAEVSRSKGKAPSQEELKNMMKEEFYLPFADNPTFTRMHRAASLLVEQYLKDYSEDLKRVWATEKPFEMHFEEGVLAGRADYPCFGCYRMLRATNNNINDLMQLKRRQTTDEGSIGTYVVCKPFNSAFFALNSDRPTDFSSLMLAALFLHRWPSL